MVTDSLSADNDGSGSAPFTKETHRKKMFRAPRFLNSKSSKKKNYKLNACLDFVDLVKTCYSYIFFLLFMVLLKNLPTVFSINLIKIDKYVMLGFAYQTPNFSIIF